MKKKRLAALMSIFLSLSLLSVFGVNAVKVQANAPQEQEAQADEKSVVWEAPAGGMDITIPESWSSSGFYMSCKSNRITPELIITNFILYTATEDEVDSAYLEMGDDSEEYSQYLTENVNDMLLIFSVNDALSKDYVKDLLQKDNPDLTFDLEEIGKADGWTFYNIVGENIMRRTEPAGDKKETLDKIMADLPGVFENIRFYEPAEEPRTKEGTAVSFETLDFDGNKVDSKELFAKNKYTMINLWMSWCHFCVEEMPALEKMSAEYAGDGIGIIGLMLDGDEEDKLEIGREINKDTGVTYPLLVPTEEMKEQLIAPGYPTTVFVNSEGIIVGDPIIGMNLEGYRERIEELLVEDSDEGVTRENNAGEASPGEAAAGDASAEQEAPVENIIQSVNNEYHVVVRNEEGEPVPGAFVQFCSETQCMMEKTDSDGVAAFNVGAGQYTIHILRVPEGYERDGTEYEAPAEPGEVFIVLKKK